MIKSLAIACVVGVTLLAGTAANACGSGGDELLIAVSMSLQSEMGTPPSTPKDKTTTAQQGGK